MKIAYLILAHKDPFQLRRLIQALNVPGATGFFIHIDAKTEADPFMEQVSGIDNCQFLFVKNRVDVFWGGMSICKAESELFHLALQHSPQFERFILLSGQDYPLWSNKRIFDEIASHPQKLYMKAYNLSAINYPPRHILGRITRYHFRDINITNDAIRRVVVGGLGRLMAYAPLRKKKNVILKDKCCDVWGGSQWLNINRECAEYIMDVWDNSRELKQYFKTSLAPDELLFQTIIYNSHFKNYAESFEEGSNYPGLEATTITHYIEYKQAQKVFVESDFEKLISSDKMFFRKVETGISDSLLDKIDTYRND